MAHALITYEEAQKAVGSIPSLAPQPNVVNIQALSTLLEQQLEKIPCTQAPEHGFVGMVMPQQIYSLRCAIPWAKWPDPGNHPAAANTSVEQTNVKTIYDANRVVLDLQENIRRAINEALNEAIPNAFRKPVGNQMGQKSTLSATTPGIFSPTFAQNMGQAHRQKNATTTCSSMPHGIPQTPSKRYSTALKTVSSLP